MFWDELIIIINSLRRCCCLRPSITGAEEGLAELLALMEQKLPAAPAAPTAAPTLLSYAASVLGWR